MMPDLPATSSPLVSSALIVGLTALGLLLAQFIGRRVARAVRAAKQLPEDRRQQILTLIQVLRWCVELAIVGIGLLMLLAAFNVNVTPLLAGAGVGGLAVSLGAQSLIKDLIGGLIILVENQYGVGDAIKVGDVAGQVERLTLRATTIRDANGNLCIVPNGDIRVVSNMTRGWSRAVVDLSVAYEEDMERVIEVLERALEAFAQDAAHAGDLLEPPSLLAPLSLGDWAFTVRVMAKTEAGKQWGLARELRKYLLAVCEREGITLPYPRQEVLLRHAGPTDSV